jgi:hypothetical protein
MRLIPYVNGTACYLHDGRARSLEEAVLWHYGEGLVSRNAFLAMSSAERADLLSFCEYPFWDHVPPSPPCCADYFGTGGPLGDGCTGTEAGLKKTDTRMSMVCTMNAARGCMVVRLVNFQQPVNKEPAVLSMYTCKGQTVFSQKIAQGQTVVRWDVSAIAPGRYIAVVAHRGLIMQKKAVVVMK